MIFNYGKNVDDDRSNIEKMSLKFCIRKKNSISIIKSLKKVTIFDKLAQHLTSSKNPYRWEKTREKEVGRNEKVCEIKCGEGIYRDQCNICSGWCDRFCSSFYL